MSNSEWRMLTHKQKDFLKSCLKRGKENVSMADLKAVYSSDKDAEKRFKQLVTYDYLEKTRLGNKYNINKEKVESDMEAETAK